MKNVILIVIIIWGFCMACEDSLRMVPENSITFENAFENEREIEIGLLSVESYVRLNLGVSNIHYPSKNGEYTDYHSESSPALLQESIPVYYTHQWILPYKIIALANVPLPYIDEVDMPQNRRDFYKGQIYFTKALVYLELGRRWGNCPIVRDEVEIKPVEYSSWVEVIDYAIELARQAVALLPEENELVDSDGNAISYKSTPSKGAANALLAHLCAWKAGCKYMAAPEDATYDEQALWATADSACTAIIERDDIYKLANTPEEVCTSVLVGGDKESIYENVYRGFWEEIPSAYQYGDFCFGKWYQTWPVATNESPGDIQFTDLRVLVETVREMYPQPDLRRDAYFYKFEEMANESTDITGGYAYPYKWRLPRVATSGIAAGQFVNFDQNRIWFRLADIILLRAECRARLGNNAGAIEDLNRVRQRANAKLYDASEYNGDLRYAIFKEREKELLMEGCRWYDILRNGYYKTELYGGFRNVSEQDILDGVFFNAVDQTEFMNNPLARQNTYWLKRM